MNFCIVVIIVTIANTLMRSRASGTLGVKILRCDRSADFTRPLRQRTYATLRAPLAAAAFISPDLGIGAERLQLHLPRRARSASPSPSRVPVMA